MAAKKANFVDGFVVPVPKRKVALYCKMSKAFAKVHRKHGAIDFIECIADDVSWGKRTSFPRSVKLKKDEVVFFSYITYPSRAVRDRAMKEVMQDPGLAKIMNANPKTWPFDGKRMIYGGFKVKVRG
jgi:uncharacterized protein YbaA (DUF1428 family)